MTTSAPLAGKLKLRKSVFISKINTTEHWLACTAAVSFTHNTGLAHSKKATQVKHWPVPHLSQDPPPPPTPPGPRKQMSESMPDGKIVIPRATTPWHIVAIKTLKGYF